MLSRKFIAKVCAVSLAIGMSPSAFAGGDDVLLSAPCSQALSELRDGLLIPAVREMFLRDVAIGYLCKTYIDVAAFCMMLAVCPTVVNNVCKAYIQSEYDRLCRNNEEFSKRAEDCWVKTTGGKPLYASYSPMQSSRLRLVRKRPASWI